MRWWIIATLLALPGIALSAEIRTIAGTGSKDFRGDNGPALKAGVVEPFGLDLGPDGALYWAEFGGHCIRRLDLTTQQVTTFAGTGGTAGYRDGDAPQAQFNQPHEIQFDPQGSLFISDMTNHVIRKIDWKTRQVSTVAGMGKPGFSGDGGRAVDAEMSQPIAVALDGTGYLICDIRNHRVRRVDFATGLISTFAGTGEKKPTPDHSPVNGTPLNGPRTVAVEPNGDVVIVLREGNAVYRLVKQTGTLHHVAGTGKAGYTGDGGDARQALLSGPKGIAVGPNGDLYLADTESHSIRVIRKETGIIETVVGDGTKGDGPDGDPKTCRLFRPHGVFFDKSGNLHIGDSSNNKVRKVTW